MPQGEVNRLAHRQGKIGSKFKRYTVINYPSQITIKNYEKNILLIFSILFLSSCGTMDKVNTITEKKAQSKCLFAPVVVINIYWNIIAKYYYLVNYLKKFKEDGLEVIFSGIFKDTETAINKLTPNDKPVFDFNAQDIELSIIEEK
ncbi:MAG: hypothetical protein R2788_13225 [Saprospiraceae bacterium]